MTTVNKKLELEKKTHKTKNKIKLELDHFARKELVRVTNFISTEKLGQAWQVLGRLPCPHCTAARLWKAASSGIRQD